MTPAWSLSMSRHESHCRDVARNAYLCMNDECVSVFLPDSKDPAEIIHDIVEFNLQVFQDIAGLHTQLNTHKETHTELVGGMGQ